MILFIDTETNGLPKWSEPSDDPGQPYLLRLSMLLGEPDTDQGTFDAYVNWGNGLEISPEITEINGITREVLEQEGQPPDVVLKQFVEFVNAADQVAAYGFAFDRRIMRTALMRNGVSREDWAERMAKLDNGIDIMAMARGVCAIPGKRGFKNPKLQEAVGILLGAQDWTPHDCMDDCRMARAVYYHIAGGGGRA